MYMYIIRVWESTPEDMHFVKSFADALRRLYTYRRFGTIPVSIKLTHAYVVIIFLSLFLSLSLSHCFKICIS